MYKYKVTRGGHTNCVSTVPFGSPLAILEVSGNPQEVQEVTRCNFESWDLLRIGYPRDPQKGLYYRACDRILSTRNLISGPSEVWALLQL